jgi:hypothetical protein
MKTVSHLGSASMDYTKGSNGNKSNYDYFYV